MNTRIHCYKTLNLKRHPNSLPHTLNIFGFLDEYEFYVFITFKKASRNLNEIN